MAKHSKSQSKQTKLQKIIQWWDTHILLYFSLFLLVFIPLYPKFPLFDITQTWVNIRVEDLLVLILFILFTIQSLRKKTTLATPLTLSICIYWAIGALSTVHALIVFVPSVPNMFSHLVVLNFLRRIEYMMLFFIVVSSIRTLKDAKRYLIAFIVGLTGVLIYGYGQKFIGWPAFSTMNEEFAKGLALRFPPRAISTFAGHYDLSAYLVLSLALLFSLLLIIRSMSIRILVLIITLASYVLLLFTKSRVSFAAYLLALTAVFFLHKRKILLIPVLLLSVVLMFGFEGVSDRFKDMFRVENVVIDIRTGEAIGTVDEYLRSLTPTPVREEERVPEPFVELPTGSKIVNVPFGSNIRTETITEIKTKNLLVASESAHLATISGEFLVKQAIVLDISLTTRLQGGWPRAMVAFRRNPLLGSGYSSISLATDNDFLRALGETGILGLLSFLLILFVFTLVVRRHLRIPQNMLARGVMIGIFAGVIGLLFNAILIDVFEASKIAYSLWMLIGVAVGVYLVSNKPKENFWHDAKELTMSHIGTFCILSILSIIYFYDIFGFKFTADDYAWLRWASGWTYSDIPKFFIDAEGFFYRPLIKTLLTFLFPIFGMQEVGLYHALSYVLHMISTMLVYFIGMKITKKWISAASGAVLFLIHPIHASNIFWMSGLSSILGGTLFLASFFMFIYSIEHNNLMKRWSFYFISILCYIGALLSYEVSYALPLILMLYYFLFYKTSSNIGKRLIRSIVVTLPFYLSAAFYMYLRNFVAHALWMSGDYNYNLHNIVFNIPGNLAGYFSEMLFGSITIKYYEMVRTYFQSSEGSASKIIIIILLIGIISIVYYIKSKKSFIRKEYLFLLFCVAIALAPALPLGTIAERYAYTASCAGMLLLGLVIADLFSMKNYIYKVLALILFITFFTIYSYDFMLTKTHWRKAGDLVQTLLRTISTTYKEFPPNTILYFVDVPIQIERAWVVPTGLDDGLWLIYQNPTLKSVISNNLEEALDIKDQVPYVKVFLYKDGVLQEAERYSYTIPIEDSK